VPDLLSEIQVKIPHKMNRKDAEKKRRREDNSACTPEIRTSLVSTFLSFFLGVLGVLVVYFVRLS